MNVNGLLLSILLLLCIAIAASYLIYSNSGYFNFTSYKPPQNTPAYNMSLYNATNCGMVHGGAQTLNSTAQLQCLSNAFNSDHNATLAYNFMGVDTDTVYNISVVSGAVSPMVVENVTNFSPVGGYHGYHSSATCSVMKLGYNESYGYNGLLIFSCSNNSTLFIPEG